MGGTTRTKYLVLKVVVKMNQLQEVLAGDLQALPLQVTAGDAFNGNAKHLDQGWRGIQDKQSEVELSKKLQLT